MKAQEIRDTYLSFFEERGHTIVPSASLVPSAHDPSVLLTTAGHAALQALLPGARGAARPRLADVQKCFRTTDIEEVGNTARHLTFFEMLGNWSFGDYFKEESIPWGWELSTEGFGMDPERIWVTVFGGDEELGLGPDEEAIATLGRAGGARRADRAARPRGQLLAGGADRPLRPLLGAVPGPRRGVRRPGERPGDDTDRFLEFWNHVFMTYDLAEDGDADRAADAQHRHRHGAGPDGGDPPGRPLGLRDRPAAAAGRPRRGAVGSLLRRGRRSHSRDADRRRPLARRRLPDRRRRRPLQRGPRLHPAPDHAAGDPAGADARARVALAGPLRRAHDRDHGEHVSGARRRAGDDRSLGRRRGGELRPHPGARHRAAGAAGRRGEGVGDLLDRRRRRLQAARHLRLPLRPDQGAARRAAGSRSTTAASRS